MLKTSILFVAAVVTAATAAAVALPPPQEWCYDVSMQSQRKQARGVTEKGCVCGGGDHCHTVEQWSNKWFRSCDQTIGNSVFFRGLIHM
jgi:predicted secreted Zn-dependent protease